MPSAAIQHRAAAVGPQSRPASQESIGALLPTAWRRPALILAGTLVLSEGLARLIHVDAGLLSLSALAGGAWLLGSRRPAPRLRRPQAPQGWIDRCQSLLPRFAALAEHRGEEQQQQRQHELNSLLASLQCPDLSASLVSLQPPPAELGSAFAAALRCSRPLRLQWGEPLPSSSASWQWSESFAHSDLLLFHLHWPLRAADLRWLESLPPGQPLWLLLQVAASGEPVLLQEELQSQWPAFDPQRLLLWDGQAASLQPALSPLSSWLRRQADQQRQLTALRVLEQLHGRWQSELEELRRRHWQRLQLRTQWIVAGGVLASPLPSLDLLVLAAANGLMLQEMARLWDCPWELETLRAAATELARAALALGVVEWTSQALLSAAKLHGATWLVGGALQALSAAYLTRVVGHAMADVLALSSGVPEADLAAIRRQAPMLVSRAAEAERIDWNGFLSQGRQWLQQSLGPATAG